MYFCINNSTSFTDKGSFFIADFACVKPTYDALGNIIGYDVVIVDSKLSSGTDFTDNQKIAKGMTGYYLRTEARKLDGTIFNENPQIFKIGALISRTKDGTNSKLPFYKIISNGSLGFGSVIPKN